MRIEDFFMHQTPLVFLLQILLMNRKATSKSFTLLSPGKSSGQIFQRLVFSCLKTVNLVNIRKFNSTREF